MKKGFERSVGRKEGELWDDTFIISRMKIDHTQGVFGGGGEVVLM